MWIVRPRMNGDSVANIENGHVLSIQSNVGPQGERTWSITTSQPAVVNGVAIIMDGYTSYEDAQDAFKELCSKLDITPVELDDPTVKADDTEEEVAK